MTTGSPRPRHRRIPAALIRHRGLAGAMAAVIVGFLALGLATEARLAVPYTLIVTAGVLVAARPATHYPSMLVMRSRPGVVVAADVGVLDEEGAIAARRQG